MSQTLPARADLRQLRAQAKDLRKAVVGGSPAALARAAAVTAGTDPASFTLRDAQLVVAREYGFAGWHDVVSAVGERQVAERDLHRWFGVELNNETWDLIEQVDADSPVADRERVLYGAYASAYHWLEAGTGANQCRGEYLIGWAALVTGLPELALRHARRCVALLDEYSELVSDWDRAFGAELVARALAATGDLAGARERRAAAAELAEVIADPDEKAEMLARLPREPWFGA